MYFKYCDISSGRNRDSQGTVECKQGRPIRSGISDSYQGRPTFRYTGPYPGYVPAVPWGAFQYQKISLPKMSFGLVQSGWGESECFNKNLALPWLQRGFQRYLSGLQKRIPGRHRPYQR